MRKYDFPFGALSNHLLDSDSRDKVLKLLLVMTLLTFFPLGIKNLVIGEVELGLMLLTFELSFLIEVGGVLFIKRSLIGTLTPLILLIICIIQSVYVFGTLASYWVFPILTTIVLLLPFAVAISANSVIVVGAVWAIWVQQALPLPIVIRFAVALVSCAAIAQFTVYMIERLQRDLTFLSTRDALTGALNRHQLDTFLQKALDGQARFSPSSIAVIDVDYFKSVNDRLGHDVGDEVLKQLVAALNRGTRKLDLLFRLGGDEFLLLFDHTSASVASTVLQEITTAIKKEPFPKGVKISLSIGVAECVSSDDMESWFKRADLALYRSKQEGRDRITLAQDLKLPQEDYPSQCVPMRRRHRGKMK